MRLWEDETEGSKEGRPGCSLLEKVFQRFALQVVPSDIFLVVFTKSLRREKQDVLRFAGRVAFIQQRVAGEKMQFVDDFDFFYHLEWHHKKEENIHYLLK